MTPFRLAQFVSSPDPGVQAALDAAPQLPDAVSGCLVSGPPRRSGGRFRVMERKESCGRAVRWVAQGSPAGLHAPHPTREMPDTPPTPASGKTSLLFHYAHAVAAEGGDVIFLTTRAAAEAAPPLLPVGVGPGAPAWGRVHMKCED